MEQIKDSINPLRLRLRNRKHQRKDIQMTAFLG